MESQREMSEMEIFIFPPILQPVRMMLGKGFAGALFQSEEVPPPSCYLESFSHDLGCFVNFFSHLEIIIWFLPFILLSRKEEILRIVHGSEQMERTT